ncbi:MAG: ABC transporter ATP-binding protein [Anaerolineales bacterium]
MINCENLVKIYQHTKIEVLALQGLDLHVESGEMIAIVGESGAGKSTLLNVIGGLDRPSAGGVTVDDQDLLKLSEKELDVYRSQKIGFLWQQTTRNLIPYLSALENVVFPMMLYSNGNRSRRQRALSLLDTVGLADRVSHTPPELSGGEQQRAAIAVALANQPEVLLADEPTGELDNTTAAEIYSALRSVNQTYGTTIIIVSHDPNIAHEVDRVVAIRDGKTSTETVRVSAPITSDRQTQLGDKEEKDFEELLMLDSTGRLQIPPDVLESMEIGERVRLEIQGEKLVLHPVEGHRRKKKARTKSLAEGIFDDEELQTEKPGSWVKRLLQWLRRDLR